MCLYLSLSALHVSDSLVHHQEQLYKLYITFGISRYHTSGCCVATATQQPDAPAYTNCDIQLQNVAPDDGLKSLKHVEHLMINKDTL